MENIELLIQILMLFVFLNLLIKLSFWRWWQMLIFSGLCALFVIAIKETSIDQSKTQLLSFLQNRKEMQDIAVFITIDSILSIAFCFSGLIDIYESNKKKNKFKFLRWYPGLLILPILYYIQTELFYSMPGINFSTISYLLGASILILFPLMGYMIQNLSKSDEPRLEMHFLLSLFVCILGLLTTVDSGIVYQVQTTDKGNPTVLKLIFVLFSLIMILGYLYNKIKWRIKKKNSMLNR